MLLPMISRLVVLLLLASAGLAQVPEGVPRQLARERAANISDVLYRTQPESPTALVVG